MFDMSPVAFIVLHVTFHHSLVSSHLSHSTLSQQPQPQTLPLLTLPICTVVYNNTKKPKKISKHIFFVLSRETIPILLSQYQQRLFNQKSSVHREVRFLRVDIQQTIIWTYRLNRASVRFNKKSPWRPLYLLKECEKKCL